MTAQSEDMTMLYLIKAGTTFPETARRYGDFDVWTAAGLGVSREDICVVDVEKGETLPPASACRGVVVTGSHAMVTDDLPWMRLLAAWIPSLVEAEVPFLGICFGHQILAHAMGGRVGYHPRGKEIGTVDVDFLPEGASDLLFQSLPSRFSVHVTHSQTVLSPPPGTVRLAANSFDHHEAIRIGACAWGVQFHPEYTTKVMRSYVSQQTQGLLESGSNPSDILRSVRSTPQSASILKRFARLAYSSSLTAKTSISR